MVSLAAWLDYAAELVKKFSITKVSAIVPGGSTGQESIYHGIKKAHELYGDKNIVLIHDGVRPLIDKETITNCIDVTAKKGNAITVSPAIETIFLKVKNRVKLERFLIAHPVLWPKHRNVLPWVIFMRLIKKQFKRTY